MEFSMDFFKDEVRNGFYIPTAIKQGWAASLMVLDEIDRICVKHGIEYYADWGSLLGAVRHGGFVPWDDDLDICMKRDDYDKFRAVADMELPQEFVIHDYERKEGHQLFLARVVSANQICFDEEHLKRYHNFPYMASVDIFILDYLYKDEEKERERCKEIKRIIAVADGILEGTLNKDSIDRELYLFEQKYNIHIDRHLSPRSMMIELYKLAEKQMARAPKDEAVRVGQIFPWVLKGGTGHPRSYYDHAIRIPFENTTIPVPAEYNDALRNHYGDYLKVRKVWGGHDYPYFEKQRENLQAVADFKLPEFTFDRSMLRVDSDGLFGRCSNDNPDADTSFRQTVSECIMQLDDMTRALEDAYTSGAYEECLAKLPECQQLAVDLGTFIEEIKSELRKSCQLAVDSIQKYCDALYGVYQYLTGEDGAEACTGDNEATESDQKEEISTDIATTEMINNLKMAFSAMTDTIQQQVIDRQEVLFLTVGPKEWKGFESAYLSLMAEDKCDIYVVPLPVVFKDFVGHIISSDDEIISQTKLEEYPEELLIYLWTEYDIALHRPDRIYIQNPYDNENPCLTIPEQYYAQNVRQFTKELIYIPPFKTAEFGREDYTDICNLKHYVSAPGVVYADRVMVQSENIRERYIERLVEFAGEETRNVWERKLEVAGADENGCCIDKVQADNESLPENVSKQEKETASYAHGKKKLLYLIGLNELSEHKETLMDRVKDRLETFKVSGGAIDTDIAFYPFDRAIWDKIDSKLTTQLLELLKEYEADSDANLRIRGFEDEVWAHIDTSFNETIDSLTDDYDAYYGSPSPFVTLFSYKKKPVMIADYDI